MRIIKTFEEYTSTLSEDALKAGEDSKIYVDDMKLDSGPEIKSAEILGAVTASKTEQEFKDYFYAEYGEAAFAEGEMDVIVGYYLDKAAEDAEAEKEAEKEEEEAEEGGDDPLADL
jgi:hypothetical protein|tara:strand:+ start:190 stop:537 length:348 start_codon:yes stop_codon:yes gene_type:complete